MNETQQTSRLSYLTIWRREAWWQLRHGEEKAGPVKSCPRTLYPNILAELEASCIFLCTVREHVNVSQEILWAVLEDGEPLTELEISRLAHLFNCRTTYLKAPTLQIVYMDSNRGKVRRATLGFMLQRIPPMPGEDFFIECERKRAVEVFQAMESENPVTYAAWHSAIDRCKYILQEQLHAAHRPRSTRLS